MERQIGYYWVRYKNSAEAEWVVAKWDGLHFACANAGPVNARWLQVDEQRIVRGDSKRAEDRREKFTRNVNITAAVLRGHRMVDVAIRHGLTSYRVRQIVHRTLEKRNPALFKSLASLRPGQITPSIGDLAAHAAEFGFPLQGEVSDGQKQ